MKRFLLLSLSPAAVVAELVGCFVAGYATAKLTIKPVVFEPRLDFQLNGTMIVSDQTPGFYLDWYVKTNGQPRTNSNAWPFGR